jgi:hypothetical protein
MNIPNNLNNCRWCGLSLRALACASLVCVPPLVRDARFHAVSNSQAQVQSLIALTFTHVQAFCCTGHLVPARRCWPPPPPGLHLLENASFDEL